MPNLSEHHSNKFVKMLLLGESGSGKTGSLASLAKAGYNLYIIDFDNGLDILANLLKDSPEALARVHYETLTDKMRQSPVGPVPVSPTSFTKAQTLLTNWPGKGPLEKWTDQDILVIDSLSIMGDRALQMAQFMEGKLDKRPELQHWGAAQNAVEGILELLYSTSTNCNVIVCTHINYIEGEEGAVKKGLPMAIGKAISPKVGRYFNSTLQVRTRGFGKSATRNILTRTEGLVELKSAIFQRIPESLPLDSGLATYFAEYKKHA